MLVVTEDGDVVRASFDDRCADRAPTVNRRSG